MFRRLWSIRLLRKISIIRPDFLLISEDTMLKSPELHFCNSFWKCNSELVVVEPQPLKPTDFCIRAEGR